MTANQISYWKYQEDKRHNQADESLTARDVAEKERHNAQVESETYRSNVADETERRRNNIASLEETHRANVAKETENKRSNTLGAAVEKYKSDNSLRSTGVNALSKVGVLGVNLGGLVGSLVTSPVDSVNDNFVSLDSGSSKTLTDSEANNAVQKLALQQQAENMKKAQAQKQVEQLKRANLRNVLRTSLGGTNNVKTKQYQKVVQENQLKRQNRSKVSKSNAR